MAEEDDIETDPLAPYQKEKVIWSEHMAEARPFLMPDDENEGEVVEILPPEKENRKIMWADEIHICEMPNRRQLGMITDEEDDEDDNSYEIEIVEDDGDADFYLEIVDGEIFYVFETEDDSDEDMDDGSLSDTGSVIEEPRPTLSLPTSQMMALPLGDDDRDAVHQTESSAMVIDDVPLHLVELEEEVVNMEDDKVVESMPQQEQGDDEVARPDAEETDARKAMDATIPVEEIPSPVDFMSPLTTPEQEPKAKMAPGPSERVALMIPSSPQAPAPVSLKAPPKSPTSPGRSILKACPPSPQRRPRENKEKKAKGIRKTYVRADTFDGEHQVFTWTKPDWVQENKLKQTDRGQDVRQGVNLASPITFPKQGKRYHEQNDHHAKDVYEDENGNVIDKEELIRRIQAGEEGVMAFVPRPTYGGKYQRKLRFSEKGQQIRSGVNLEKPITKATVDRKRDDINLLAQPKDVLKKHVQVEKKEYGWQKPEWAKKAPNKLMHSPSKARKHYTWDAPEWTKPNLKGSGRGDAMKKLGKLEKPITHIAEHVRRHSGTKTGLPIDTDQESEEMTLTEIED
ncbi:hypothetical protein FisN_5Lh295 [Fistulifera solaris]|uniref:Uncharacterized protein n=1 Tax=Fistulifera solaris TaxID=1519565 RepID=A0A1Z5KFZ4_FISSO|nr:hypothetical protein FisN_5Lh295 [Fistulifera solaris]|eukprot:GAX25213.1 hypothetical protein FisN_5Lh295 [Fistulifera solaris]